METTRDCDLVRTVNLDFGPLWLENYRPDDGHQIVVNAGGSSSGKSYTVMQMLMFRCCTERNKLITVVCRNYPMLYRGCCRDMKQIWNETDFFRQRLSEPNNNGCRCAATGSVIECVAYLTEGSARSGKRSYLFVDECNTVPKEIFEQLYMRTKERTWVAFNPTSRFYIHEMFEKNAKAKWIYSDHRANTHIPDQMHEYLESLRETDYERWRVYARGMTGKVEGLVYKNWGYADALPPVFRWRAFGLDWGWSSDPNAIVEVRFADGELWVKEHLYRTGMLNNQIAEALKGCGAQDEVVVCDSAEGKSIAEIRSLGIRRAVPVRKGPGSVKLGIDAVSRFHLNVVRGSDNIAGELMRYQWETDALGRYTGEPVDRDNHALDALRYVVLNKVVERGGQHRSSL